MKSQAEQVEEIRIRTEAWINGWSTSPDAPFQMRRSLTYTTTRGPC